MTSIKEKNTEKTDKRRQNRSRKASSCISFRLAAMTAGRMRCAIKKSFQVQGCDREGHGYVSSNKKNPIEIADRVAGGEEKQYMNHNKRV